MSQIQNNESSADADSQELQSPEGLTEALKTPDVSTESTEKFKLNEDELDTYNKVLEKLDIKSKAKAELPAEVQDVNQAVQEKFMQERDLKSEAQLNHNKDFENSQKKIQVENIVAQDFAKIQNLMQFGLINSLQGQNLKQQVLKKAFDNVVQNELVQQNSPPASQNKSFDKSVVFSEFHKDKPDFFNSEGRKEVLDYLKSDDVIIGKDELKKISSMVEHLEKTAIDRYLKNEAHQKSLNNSNEVAKQKLTANAQNSSFQDKNFLRTFTRGQIGKMSGAEFAKYEPLIMEQLKKGLIQ